MLKYKDFVPKEIEAPGFFKEGQHESFNDALEEANKWLSENRIALVSIETVVLPNIWSRWEEGSDDASLGTSSDAPSRWHQFIRCWYKDV
jgi:hypothetical protein